MGLGLILSGATSSLLRLVPELFCGKELVISLWVNIIRPIRNDRNLVAPASEETGQIVTVEIVGIDPTPAVKSFGSLYLALRYRAPPWTTVSNSISGLNIYIPR